MNKVSIPADALGLHHSTLPTTIVPDSRDPLQINGHIQVCLPKGVIPDRARLIN